MRHIPNVLCVIRILLVGVFIAFFCEERYFACMITYITAFLTDILDGYLARRNNWITNIGKLLDPLADKLMLIVTLACFYFKGWLPLPILILACIKEFLMIFGGLFVLKKKNFVVYSDWFGKTAAGCFNIAVILTLLENTLLPAIGIWDFAAYAVAVVLAIIALFHYAKQRVFNDPNSPKKSRNAQ